MDAHQNLPDFMYALVAIFAVVAFFWVLILNLWSYYLTQTSIQRKTTFYRRILPFSHISLLLMLISTLCMICSYFHPELFYLNKLYCVEWYMLACICYATSMYFLKIAYLVRLNMVNNPENANQWSKGIVIYIIFFILMCLFIDYVQYLTIYGEALFKDSYSKNLETTSTTTSTINNNNNNNNSNSNVNTIDVSFDILKFGCIAGFSRWNGYLACLLMTIDGFFFYKFVRSYLTKIKQLIIVHEKKMINLRRRQEEEKLAKEMKKLNDHDSKCKQSMLILNKEKEKENGIQKEKVDTEKTNEKEKHRKQQKNSKPQKQQQEFEQQQPSPQKLKVTNVNDNFDHHHAAVTRMAQNKNIKKEEKSGKLRESGSASKAERKHLTSLSRSIHMHDYGDNHDNDNGDDKCKKVERIDNNKKENCGRGDIETNNRAVSLKTNSHIHYVQNLGNYNYNHNHIVAIRKTQECKNDKNETEWDSIRRKNEIKKAWNIYDGKFLFVC